METKGLARLRRKERTRKKIQGSEARPRLSVCRSLKHLTAQLIDDGRGVTLWGLSSLSKDFKGKSGGNVDGAKAFGRLFGEKARQKNFSRVVFDRGGFLYHGRIKAFAEGAREGGLQF